MTGRALALGFAVAIAITGCSSDCTQGPDIQVTVIAGPSVDPRSIDMLRISLSIDGAPPRSVDLKLAQPLGSGNSAFVIKPDPAPSTKYNVALTVEAMAPGGGLIAIGAAGGDVMASGCNRLEARLVPLPGGPDAGGMPDGAVDMSTLPPDLSGCSGGGGGGGPDEDQDGRVDDCDLCPADSDPTPTDSDGDGLPDACDPDNGKSGNKLLYFEGFNGSGSDWSGGFPVDSGGFLNVMANGTVVSGNGTTALPVGARVQASMLARVVFAPFNESDMGLFLGTSPNPGGSTTSGMLCTITYHQQSNTSTLDLATVQNGAITGGSSQPFGFGTQIRYRMRLTQRGASYTCEVVSSGSPPTNVSRSAPSTPVGPQFMVLSAENIEAHFYSVVAESVVP